MRRWKLELENIYIFEIDVCQLFSFKLPDQNLHQYGQKPKKKNRQKKIRIWPRAKKIRPKKYGEDSATNQPDNN